MLGPKRKGRDGAQRRPNCSAGFFVVASDKGAVGQQEKPRANCQLQNIVIEFNRRDIEIPRALQRKRRNRRAARVRNPTGEQPDGGNPQRRRNRRGRRKRQARAAGCEVQSLVNPRGKSGVVRVNQAPLPPPRQMLQNIQRQCWLGEEKQRRPDNRPERKPRDDETARRKRHFKDGAPPKFPQSAPRSAPRPCECCRRQSKSSVRWDG